MKRFITTILVLITFSQIFSQPTDTSYVPRFDSGYYYGLCFDDDIKSKFDKYLFIQFLSNDGDSLLSIVPYRIKKNTNPSVNKKNYKMMNDTINKYLCYLSSAVTDIEYTDININPWTIVGFDNYSYYETKGDSLFFSLNIVDIETEEIEIFYFNGAIKNKGKEIEAIVYSDRDTFKRGNMVLKYIPNEN